MPQHPARFAENDLDQARIFLDLFRQCQCVFARLYGGEIDIAAFRLGYDFLRNHDHVPVKERGSVRLAKPANYFTEIRSRLDQREMRQRKQRQGTGRSRLRP